MSKGPDIVQLGIGLYADKNETSIILISPSEMLDDFDLPKTQEGLFSIFAQAKVIADDRGLELVLIDSEGAPSTKELIAEELLSGEPIEGFVAEWDGVERRRFVRKQTNLQE